MCSPIYGSAIGTASASASCTFQTTTVTGTSCSIPVAGSSVPVSATAAASANATPWTISVQAQRPNENPNWNSSAQASDFGTFTTDGPVRSGYVSFDVVFGVHNLVSGASPITATISDGTHTYLFSATGAPVPPTVCAIDLCEFKGELPFLLGSGTTFQVSLSDTVSASASCPRGVCELEKGSIDFSLFEANKTTPVAFTATPEPASWLFLAFGMAGLGCRRINRVKND